MQASNNATLHESGPPAPNVTCQAYYKWPSDTEIILFPGTNKVMLTIQTPLMCLIFQDTFEHLQALLLFIHMFPDPALTHSMISEALTVMTQSHLPGAATIRHCLELDNEYLSKMCRLVSPLLVTHFEYMLTDAFSPVCRSPFSEGRSRSNVLG